MAEAKSRILCIDDEEMIRRTIADYLTDSGFQVSEAENGKRGLEVFEKENPDLVLVDLRMPGVDGLEVLGKVTSKSSETPIIVVSGTGVFEDAIEALRRGAWDYILKPIEDMAILEIAVKNALNHSRLIKENRKYQENLELEVKKRTAQLNEAHEQLKEQHAFLQTLIESIPNPIFYKNAKGEYQSCNKSFCSMLGLSHEQIIGKTINEVIPDELIKLFKETDEKVFEGQGTQNYEFSLKLPDSSLHYFFNTKAPIKNLKGEITGIVGVSSDITALKIAEKEKTQLEEQLRHSQKMEAIGTLAGGIAHDFNNILQAMSGYVQLLLMKKDSDNPDYKYLTRIQQATERATSLVKRLLTFSRKSETRFQQVNLNNIVNNTIQLLKQTIPLMIRIETNLYPNLSNILADPNQIEQVLMNLAGNAFDAMPEGGMLLFETENIPFTVEYRDRYLELKPGNYVMLKVSDTGCGMNEYVLKHMFEPFFTTKEVGKGTGLGLATVYGIIKGHNGRIGCYSEASLGTTFKIYLPVEQNESSDLQAEEEKKYQIKGGNETILVVDDEDSILDIAEEVLTEQGYFVIKAKTGEEALEIYRRNVKKIKLVILDLGMPGMGGEKCLNKLLKINSAVKIIVSSGYSAHKMALNPEKYRAYAFVGKPYHINDMLYKIRKALDIHK